MRTHASKKGHMARVQRKCTSGARAMAMLCTNGVHSTCVGVRDAPTIPARNICTNDARAHAMDGGPDN
eukprot:11226432-Lingulodinium_polyedra.AAC.1